MSIITKSPIARQVPKLKDVSNRTEAAYGLVVHQTGSGIVEAAKKKKIDPLEYATAYYLKPDSYFAHYLIGWDGTIVQLADELEKASHVGLSVEERKSYLDGTWKTKVSSKTLELWTKEWGNKYKSPSHLYPGSSVNNVYLGVELIPDAPTAKPGLKYSPEQHVAVAELGMDIAKRWGLPKGWHLTSRLVTHEEVNPLTRSQKSGGWDPGKLRDKNWINWKFITDHITQCS